MKGRLKENISFWEEIGTSSWVLSILVEGYALPFISEPEPKIFQNNISALRNKEFVTNEILDLLSSGRVREMSQSEIEVLNPLTAADNGQKLRLILYYRHINSFLRVPKFKCDDIHTIRDLFEVGDYFFKFDIKSGFHHIDILEAHKKYLGFSWEFDGKIRYYVFSVLVFGLATAPFVFTKVVRVLIKHWRSLAIRIFAFIDDVFGGGSSFKDALNFSNIVRRDLLKSGFVAHPIKSEWIPKQEGQHLGFLVNLKQGLFSVPPKKVISLKHKLELFRSSQKTTARRISSLVGTIVSTGIAIGPVARMWTRSLHALVKKAPSWDSPITSSDNASAGIEFWSLCFEKFNRNHIWPTSPIVNVMSCSDSSDFA